MYRCGWLANCKWERRIGMQWNKSQRVMMVLSTDYWRQMLPSWGQFRDWREPKQIQQNDTKWVENPTCVGWVFSSVPVIIGPQNPVPVVFNCKVGQHTYCYNSEKYYQHTLVNTFSNIFYYYYLLPDEFYVGLTKKKVIELHIRTWSSWNLSEGLVNQYLKSIG